MTDALDQVAELVRRRSGISPKPHQYAALGLALGRAAPGLDAAGFLRLAADPVAGPAVVDRLVDEVANKETSFFRDAGQLEQIEWRLLCERARAAGRHDVRVWSAGCATGQEPYSLAILACEAFGTQTPPVSILGSDLSATALAQAAQATYPPRALRTVEPSLRERHFRAEGDAFTVRDHVRNLVRFIRHNLVHDPIPPLGETLFDLVLCRNVLIYFDGDTVERVRASLERAVHPGGVLVLGAADALPGTIERLARIAAAEPEPPPRPIRGMRRPRRPLGRKPRPPQEQVAPALLDAEAHFLEGMEELDAGDTAGAIDAFRRALFLDPALGLAAFGLGRAHDLAGDRLAARRAYEQALRTLQPEDDRHRALLDQIDPADVAAACRARVSSLR